VQVYFSFQVLSNKILLWFEAFLGQFLACFGFGILGFCSFRLSFGFLEKLLKIEILN
jgi:hypothetical protein